MENEACVEKICDVAVEKETPVPASPYRYTKVMSILNGTFID